MERSGPRGIPDAFLHPKLEQLLKEFRLNWAKSIAKQVPEHKKLEYQHELLCVLCDFTSKVEMTLRNETKDWILEFRRNLSAVDKLVNKGNNSEG